MLKMMIREMRTALGDTQSEFAARYNIPFRTIQNWEAGVRKPPDYIIELLSQRVRSDLANRRTVNLPEYDPKKRELPKRRDFIGSVAWLKAVQACLGEDIVFALDQALMCQGNFGGRSDEHVVWVYGDDTVTDYNGVVILGNRVSPYDVERKNGLRYTNLSRTISDAFANELILDMQGITEAVSRYYYANGEKFNGISVPPEYQERFEKLAIEAIEYYEAWETD
ncbi:MAG: helix-turn-helix domain-containing protein [Clostridiaceae bacterium]|jgi:transcriptional regulator with XRE-family HTH domain|nr:helix-turn-helix domain-containing protein [Clostridiaceae bacterium]